MTPLQFYRDQAAQQKTAADAATLQNVRDRCQRASAAWAALATRSERIELQRAASQMFDNAKKNQQNGPAAATIAKGCI